MALRVHCIRLVTFDALYTIIKPRLPIAVQYTQVFEPFLGALDPELVRQSFKVALKAVQLERPSYKQGADNWWSEVIYRTALGAGANQQTLDNSLSKIVPSLLARFSSKAGYGAYDDAISTIKCLHNDLDIRTAVLSNGDSRIRAVLKDLSFPDFLRPIVLSEEEGVEKPSREIFMRVLQQVNDGQSPPIQPDNCLHVGDEYVCDYEGATKAGMKALLLQRAGEDSHAYDERVERLREDAIVKDLNSVIERVRQLNDDTR